MADERDDLIGTQETLQILHVSESTLSRWVRQGLLACYNLPGKGRERFFKRGDVLEMRKPVPRKPRRK